jgi:hypothetical protein
MAGKPSGDFMRKGRAVIALIIALPSSSFALSLGIGAHAHGDLAGALSGTFADAAAERYADLGAASLGSRGSSATLPLLAWGGGVELDIYGLFAPRLDLAIGLGYGLWGWGLVGKDSGGQRFASMLLYAPVIELSAEARYSFPLGSASVEPGFGPFLGVIAPKYVIEERISGVVSSLDPKPSLADALVAGIRASLAYVRSAGPGKLRLGASLSLAFALASENGNLGASLLWPWKLSLDMGYVFPLAGGKR